MLTLHLRQTLPAASIALNRPAPMKPLALFLGDVTLVCQLLFLGWRIAVCWSCYSCRVDSVAARGNFRIFSVAVLVTSPGTA